MSYPEDLRYTKEHEWARKQGNHIQVGITEYAVKQLGDVTLVDLAAKDKTLGMGDRFGDVESVKTVSELFSPCAGKIEEINEALQDQPELINESPYEDGWMVRIALDNPADFDALMSAEDYQAYVQESDC